MIAANKLYEVQSHVAMTGHMHSVLAVFINEDVWQGLSEDNRATITRSLTTRPRIRCAGPRNRKRELSRS